MYYLQFPKEIPNLQDSRFSKMLITRTFISKLYRIQDLYLSRCYVLGVTSILKMRGIWNSEMKWFSLDTQPVSG